MYELELYYLIFFLHIGVAYQYNLPLYIIIYLQVIQCNSYAIKSVSIFYFTFRSEIQQNGKQLSKTI